MNKSKKNKTNLKIDFNPLIIIFSSFLFLSACGSDNPAQEETEEIPSLNSINFDATTVGVNSNITLKINGEDLLTTASDTLVSGSAMLAVGDTYTLSYLSSTNQLCRIDNPTGTIESDSSSFLINITCLNWADPANFNDKLSISSEDTSSIDLAIANNGDAVVVWEQSNGSNIQIFMSEYRNGVLTNPSSLLDNISPNGTDAISPKVAINNTGDTVITWVQSDGIIDQIFMSEYRNNTWTHPVDEFDSISINNQFASAPDVAINDNGDTIIAWTQSDGSRDQIFISEYRNATWTHPADLTDNISPNGQDTSAPKVAINSSGDSLVVWKQLNGTHQQVFMSEYRNNTWTHPADINDNISPDSTNTSNPEVAINDSGESLITWYQSNTSFNQVYMSEYRNNTWTNPSDLTDHISPTGRPATNPKLALSNNSDAVIVWQQSNIANEQIFMSEFRDNTWSHPIDLNDKISFSGTNAQKPDVSINSLGETFISWQQVQVLREQIYRSEYRNNTWTHPIDSSENISLSAQAAVNSKTATNDNGEALIVWEQLSGTSIQVFQSSHR